jgi:hypothetical protein
LPFAGDSVSSAPDANVEEALCVGAGPETWAIELGNAAVDDDISVELILPATVHVTVAPVLMPVGPNTIGTMICSIFPSLSVVVLV